MNRSIALAAVAVLVAAALAALTFVGPIAQDPGYHLFADTRRILGVQNFWNVFSNAGLALAGTAGLIFLRTDDRPGILATMYPLYVSFFAGVFLSGAGSAWYHLAPGHQSLVWDRLPMSLAFMSFLAIVIGEQLSPTLARRCVVPLLLAGVGSVLYWYFGTVEGVDCSIARTAPCGDLRPYVLVQFLPLLIIPLLLAFRSSPFDRSAFLWLMILGYAVAKAFEQFDEQVFTATKLLSGHSIKHLVAAVAALLFLYGLDGRRPVRGGED